MHFVELMPLPAHLPEPRDPGSGQSLARVIRGLHRRERRGVPDDSRTAPMSAMAVWRVHVEDEDAVRSQMVPGVSQGPYPIGPPNEVVDAVEHAGDNVETAPECVPPDVGSDQPYVWCVPSGMSQLVGGSVDPSHFVTCQGGALQKPAGTATQVQPGSGFRIAFLHHGEDGRPRAVGPANPFPVVDCREVDSVDRVPHAKRNSLTLDGCTEVEQTVRPDRVLWTRGDCGIVASCASSRSRISWNGSRLPSA